MRLLFFLLTIQTILIAQSPYAIVLGVAQDGGFPQAGCSKKCCEKVWKNPALKKHVSSMAIIDPKAHSAWIIDATPDFKEQYQMIKEIDPKLELKGILLTHAHIGHYAGLLQLGREVMSTNSIEVYCMPRMVEFLKNNGPWSQLVTLQNIKLVGIKKDSLVHLNPNISFLASQVPHRDEFSETVAYEIKGKSKNMFFLPDIDKWDKWNQKVENIILKYDHLFLDGTFYQDGEISRPMAEVPHPFVIETIKKLEHLPLKEKQKVHFIHLNHTNPLLNHGSMERKKLELKSFKIAMEGQKINLQ